MNKTDEKFDIELKTDHYSFTLHYTTKKDRYGYYSTGQFYVGSLHNPCLLISVFFPVIKKGNNRFVDFDTTTAILVKVKNLRECILSDFGIQESSFAYEMIISVLNFFKTYLPQIHFIKLTDTSYIPCNGDSDTLDLLYYNVAVHKKTWYELKFNAILQPLDEYIKYRCAIEKYATQETKTNYSWQKLFTFIQLNNYAYFVVNTDFEIYESLFNLSKTFPEFFIAINKKISKEEKCKFFDYWLVIFMESILGFSIPRTWYIDNRETPKFKGGRRKTLKKRNK